MTESDKTDTEERTMPELDRYQADRDRANARASETAPEFAWTALPMPTAWTVHTMDRQRSTDTEEN